MTAHDQHTEARQPTEEREVSDNPDARPNFSAAEADAGASTRGPGALETEPPPLETQASDRQIDTQAPSASDRQIDTQAPSASDRQFDTQAPSASDRQFDTRSPQASDTEFEKVPVAAAPLTTDANLRDTEASATHRTAGQAEPATDGELFAADELAGLRARWDNVQAGFVDDPRECVHKADSLVSDVVKQLTSGFSAARERLEEQWARGEQASTEDLRVALTQYREFFQRLLAV